MLQKGYGHLGWTSDSPDVNADRTIYDLASLSKVIGTTTGAMILYDEGRLDLDAPVSRYIPEFSGGDKDLVTVRHLLTHRSGLPAGRELWRMSSNAIDARRIVLSTPLVNKPGAVFVYSDLGADVLAWVVEAISGLSLDTYLAERVFKPLGMNDTFYNPPDSVRYRVAPTEVAPPRGYPLKGEVHDENAFALGGVAGHAGLFSTASDLAIFAQMMLNGGEYDDVRIFSDSTVALFTRRSAGTRALGWDTADGDGGSGEYLTAAAFGHTGYTGTSIWIDPEREMFVVLLTNRVHAARARRPAKVIADVRADLADAAALSVEDTDRILAMPASFRADRADGWNKAVRTRRTSRAKPRSQDQHQVEHGKVVQVERQQVVGAKDDGEENHHQGQADRAQVYGETEVADQVHAGQGEDTAAKAASACFGLSIATPRAAFGRRCFFPVDFPDRLDRNTNVADLVSENARTSDVRLRAHHPVCRPLGGACRAPRRRRRRSRPTADREVAVPTSEPVAANATDDAAITTDQVKLALRRVKDPELNLNILDLGLVYDMAVEGSDVKIDMSLTSPGCPSGPEIMGDAERQLRAIPGVGDVAVNLVWSPPWTPERIEPRVRAYLGF